jgi:NAD(P)-dependent dehydrogenase (short-subunit alcohol dehydrogenase family)
LNAGWRPVELVRLFARLRDALVAGAERVVVVCNETTRGGIAGMVRTLAKEWPDRLVKAVILGSGLDEAVKADRVFAELGTDGPAVVKYGPAGRFETTVVRADLPKAAPSILTLDQGSVVLLTGGARGITARVAKELASRFHCNLEIVGRTPEPTEPEDPELAAARDLPSLRRAIIARAELREPAAIEAACSRIMANREVRTTLDGLHAAGSTVVYHAVDVRDSEALSQVIDDVYARHGKIDVVIHAAGVIEDKLAVDKTNESFCRVFDTKVAGATTLLQKLRDDVRSIVFFSSVAGAFGNRGQVDYATANDYLDCLARDVNGRSGARVVSIGWGPWGDGGMVSPALEREYAVRGIELIEPEAGVESFLNELLNGHAEDAHVILMRAFPSGFA